VGPRFQTNVYAPFRLVRAALPHLKKGASIIITSSETGLFGNKQLLDYSSTKGGLNAFVKSLAQNLVEKGIRVNAVAPGPVWTPLNPVDTGLPAERVKEFGGKTPMGRPGELEEMAPAHVFFASDADSSYITGHVLPVLGGEVSGSYRAIYAASLWAEPSTNVVTIGNSSFAELSKHSSKKSASCIATSCSVSPK
jgi:NAD(P)-dependent dehydrogenase (short-subunit alcohol dehydrogenase family)